MGEEEDLSAGSGLRQFSEKGRGEKVEKGVPSCTSLRFSRVVISFNSSHMDISSMTPKKTKKWFPIFLHFSALPAFSFSPFSLPANEVAFFLPCFLFFFAPEEEGGEEEEEGRDLC